MSVLLSTSGSRGDVKSLMGLAVRLRALGAPFDSVAAVVEGGAERVSTGVLPTGG